VPDRKPRGGVLGGLAIARLGSRRDNRTMTTLYGIPNCDTVKRARDWLATQGVAYEFHDFKKAGVPPERLAAWVAAAGWERVLNRKGTTWRKLDAAQQAGVTDAASAQALMREQASVIKRPVVEWDDGRITVGFDAAAWAAGTA
jgi:arsenate reductase